MKSEIQTIGEELTHCQDNCVGVVANTKKGIIPRCLLFQDGVAGGNSSIIVGLNPGKSSRSERKYYLQHGIGYGSATSYLLEKSPSIAFYTKMRRLLEALNIDGPVLWTELVKCEVSENFREPPLQTQRHCVSKYLLLELSVVPDSWPIIALSAWPFRAMSFMMINRPVVGVPHPTGSYGHFDRLFLKHDKTKLRKSVVESYLKAIRNNLSVWLQ
jgi:hypothetical protein